MIYKLYLFNNIKGLSRGRGIKCFKNLEKLLNYIIGKDLQWVGQKYMENIMIINNRKVIN